ncbi:hypothetical protein MHBO_001780 [Bonamia ostreae]|uniref:Timeless N-terminal domain-containing protein n=1 Tax=Bonamia ostreae TaxID=126728 RepID=A0ABV2AK63_9EUKA
MESFIAEDWLEFMELLQKMVENETRHFLPNLLTPGLNMYPGENSIAYLCTEYISECNSFLAKLGPSEYTLYPTCILFQFYEHLRKLLKSEKSRKFLTQTTIQKISMLFLDYRGIFRRKSKDITEEELALLQRMLLPIKNKRKTLHLKQDALKSTKVSREFISEANRIQNHIFKILKDFILKVSDIELVLTILSGKMYSLFKRLIFIFFQKQQLKKGVVSTFINLDLTKLEVDVEKSLARRSQIFSVLNLKKPTLELEAQESEKPFKSKKALSSVTKRLCVYYDNTFELLEAMRKFESRLQNFVKRSLGKSVSAKWEKWDMKPLFEQCDLLLEIIALRIALYDSKDFFQNLFKTKNLKNAETSEKLSNYTITLAQIREFTLKENCHFIIEATRSMVYKLLEWMLLDSDRTFTLFHGEELSEAFDDLNLVFNFFLPEDRRSEVPESVTSLLKLMGLGDSDLLNVYREARDKGVIKNEYLGRKEKEVSSSQKVMEKQELTLTSFFEVLSADEEPEEKTKKGKDNSKMKLNKSEKTKILEKLLSVISRRRTELCRKFAVDNKKKVPVEIKSDQESDSSDYSASDEDYNDSGNDKANEDSNDGVEKEKTAQKSPKTSDYDEDFDSTS